MRKTAIGTEMTDFKIDSRPKDPFEKVKVEDVIKKKEEQERGSQPLPPQEPIKKFAAGFLSLLQRFINSFTSPEKKVTITMEEVFKDLIIFKSLLEKLSTQDLSKESSFLNELSFFWIKLTHDISYCIREKDATISSIESFIDKINFYPPGKEFSLGYYLSNLAGFKWTPFPFLEILQTLHQECKEAPKTSNLSTWLQSLYTILEESPYK
jgi:hypothetical protein